MLCVLIPFRLTVLHVLIPFQLVCLDFSSRFCVPFHLTVNIECVLIPFHSSSLRASSKPGAGVGLVSTFNLIKEVQKKYRTREQEKKELEGYVEQAPLMLNTSRGNPRLKDLYMRPVIGSRRIQVCEGVRGVRV